MRGLIIKDINLLIDRKKIPMYLGVFGICIINLRAFPELGTAIIPFLTLSVLLTTITYDQADNNFRFLFSLPISRNTYVKEKYLLSLISGILSALFSVFLVFLFSTNSSSSLTIPKILFYSTLSFLCFTLMAVPYLPVILKFGNEQSQAVMVLLMVSIFIGSSFLLQKVNLLALPTVRDVLQLIDQNLLLFSLLLISVCVILLLFSYLLSLKIMQKKSF